MKRFFSIILLSSFVLIFSGCGDSPETTEEKSALADLKTVAFEVQTPDDWEVIPEDQYPQNVVLVKREPSFSDEISSLLSVSVEQGVYHSLIKFSERNLENIRKNSQDFQLEERQEFVLSSGENAFLVHYSDWYSRGKKRVSFYDLYVIDVKNDKSYAISIIFDPQTSENHKEFLQNVLKTFTLPSE